MGYRDILSETSTINGTTSSEINKSKLQDSFNVYFNESPNKVDVAIEGIQEDVIIQHSKYGEDSYDNQLLITQNTTNSDYGKKLVWNMETWLIINKENRAIDTHKAWKIQLTNNSLVWKDSIGDVVSEPCFIRSFRNSIDSSNNIQLAEDTWNIRIQYNDGTSNIKLNQRFIFDNKVVYKVSNLNYSEFKNQIQLTMKIDQKREEDDFDNNIAYNDFNDESVIINGLDEYKFNYEEVDVLFNLTNEVTVFKYASDILQPTTFDWRIDGIDSANYELDIIDDNTIEIRCLNYPFSGNLVAISQDDLYETSIPIDLKGAW